MESHKRSIVKTLTWRVLATFITFIVAYLLTRKIELAWGIGLADTGIKMFAYYMHERTWDRVYFGRKKKPDADYSI